MYHILLQTRMTSSRLPGKAMLSFYGYPLFIASAKRTFRFSSSFTICTSSDSTDDPIEIIAKTYGFACFRGALDNVLKRFYDASLTFNNNDIIIRLTADNPLPDVLFLQTLSLKWEKSDIEYLCSADDSDTPRGLMAEFFSVSSLREAYQHMKTDHEKEHVTPYIRRNKKMDCVSLNLKSHDALPSYTIDTLNDYLRVYKLMNAHDSSLILTPFYDFLPHCPSTINI